MAAEFTSTSYPSIRAVIDTSLTTAELPDGTIQLTVFHGAAEAEVKARVEEWADLDGDAATRTTRAWIYLTAALLVTAIPHLTAERSADGQSYTRQAVDPAALAASLRARADAEIAAVTDAEPTGDRPTAFVLASGRRGR